MTSFGKLTILCYVVLIKDIEVCILCILHTPRDVSIDNAKVSHSSVGGHQTKKATVSCYFTTMNSACCYSL